MEFFFFFFCNANTKKKTENLARPKKIEDLQRPVCVIAAAGGRSAAVEATGDLYEFGQGVSTGTRYSHILVL
jgi:hypothetical protein